jgi:hypothetical protein
MPLKATTFKKPRKKTGASTKQTPVESFLLACDVQSRIVDGATVLHKVTKKPIKSWVREVHGQKAVVPKVGTFLLLGKGKGYAIDDKMTAKQIIAELKKEVAAGKHVRKINKFARGTRGRSKKA